MSSFIRVHDEGGGIRNCIVPENLSAIVDANSITGLTYKYKRDFQIKKFTVADNMESAATEWNNNRTGCTLANDASIILDKADLSNSLKVSVTGSYLRFQRSLASPMTMTGTVNLWVYFVNDPNFGSSIEFWTTTDNANWATKYVKYYWACNTSVRKGWNCLSMHTAEDSTTTVATITSAGGDTLGGAINGFKIIANSMNVGTVFHIGGIFWGGSARPNVLVNLDDGSSGQWNIFNIFRARGIPLSLAIITSKIGQTNYLTWDQLDYMYSWGCDIIPHSVTHPPGGLSGLSLEDAKYELMQSRQTLLDHGYSRTSSIFAWPENAYVSTVGVDLINLAISVGYKLSRGSSRRDLPTAQGIDNPMRLPSADIGGRTLAQILKILDAAERYKQTNILYGHRLTGTVTTPASGGTPPVNGLEWYWSDYVALADDIASRYTNGTLTPITMSELAVECRY